MVKINYYGITLLVVLALTCLLFLLPINAYAADRFRVPVLELVDMPADFNEQINDSCSGHSDFMQVSAQDDGAFVVYSRSMKDSKKPTFQQVFIDVYDPEGVFVKEISFMSPQDLAVEMVDDRVVVYFYSNVYVYDLREEETYYYSSSGDHDEQYGLFSILREQPFKAGEWTYSCSKSIFDDYYTTLVRTNGENEQILVSLDGDADDLKARILPVLLGMICILSIPVLYKKLKKT